MAPDVSREEQSRDDEGWHHVTSKGRRGRRNVRRAFEQPGEPRPRTEGLRTVAELETEYRSTREQWEASTACAQLRELIAASASMLRPISKGICLGIGSFDPPDGGWETKRKTFVQLAAFLTTIDELESRLGAKIPCFFQDPIFTTSDKGLISTLGYEVVNSPAACDMVDADCLLYGVHLYRPIYALAFQYTSPAIFVGTGWDVWDQVSLSPSSDLDNMKAMERSHKKSNFPQHASTTAFTSTSFYVRLSQSGHKVETPSPQAGSSTEDPEVDSELIEQLASAHIS